MDSDATTIIVILLSVLSYIVTFFLGYGMRSYLYSHERRNHQLHYD